MTRSHKFLLAVYGIFMALIMLTATVRADWDGSRTLLKGHCEGSTYVFNVKNIGTETAQNLHWRMFVAGKQVTGGYITLAPEQRITYPMRFNAPVSVRVEVEQRYAYPHSIIESVELTCH